MFSPHPIDYRPRAFVFALLAAFLGGSPLAGMAQSPLEAKKEAPESRKAPWRVFGKVTGPDGKPMAGVEVRAYCGMGTLRETGSATSAEDGRFEMDFGPGIFMTKRKGPWIQSATISAHKQGYFEANLSRQGDFTAADGPPDEAQRKLWGSRADRLFLPDEPREINFAMLPTARVSGRLVNEQGKPLTGYGVGLSGASPPSMGAVRGTQADAEGRFTLDDVPTTFRYQFVVSKSDRKPPWNDSWASAALRFERPETGDLRAWFGNRELRIEEFILRVTGPGMHGREATPIAGNAGLLSLTAPAEGSEVTDALLAAKTATLTIRNTSQPDISNSLITESEPVAPANESATKLTRTHPDAEGNFTISFENPSGYELEPGKHQVVFQVFVGTSRKPIREKIFRQLDPQPDRYEVPVKIAPEWIDDSRVSLTFLTIQPNHDDWIKSFFHEGKGTSYKGLWAGDDGPLPAIPFASPNGE